MLEQLNQLTPATMPLDNIYLDPNNPRLSETEQEAVAEDQIDERNVQDRLMDQMEQLFATGRLADSIESNGFLPIDRVIIRQFKEGKFVVLEGNRRITAAKRLWRLHTSERKQLDPRVADTLREIPVLIYTGTDPEAAWIFQGLRHLSGIKDWSAYNKARLLVRQIEEHNLSLTEAGRLFGVSAIGAGQWVRGYYAYRQALDHPDFQKDVDPRIFPVLQELFGRSNIALKDWMQWNESNKRFDNEDYFGEFLSWFYPKDNEQGEPDPDVRGDWDKRRVPRTLDLRHISELVSKYSEQFQEFRQGTPLNRAIGKAFAKEEHGFKSSDEFVQWLADVISGVSRIPVLQLIQDNKQQAINTKITELEAAVSGLKRLMSNA